ncbi:MAG TPA: hypothetical protein VF241_16075, partial [Propionibacteriaceae bacterium]
EHRRVLDLHRDFLRAHRETLPDAGRSVSPMSCQQPVTDVLSLGTTYWWGVETEGGASASLTR